jgi:phosphatidate cytidylyltransferase
LETSKHLNPLVTRVISAAVAVLVVIALIYFLKTDGLRLLLLSIPILGIRELHRMLFQDKKSKLLGLLFAACVFAIFSATAFYFTKVGLVIGVCFAVFNAAALLYESRYSDLQSLSQYQGRALTGMLYLGLLPGLAFQMLNLEFGTYWFLGMLGMVFAGDTMAYAFGVKWGSKKLLPNVSPKKTWEGSAGGLLGSAAAGFILWTFVPQFQLWALLSLALSTGIIAQLGDLYESMLKRIANIKDSGRIMPGHGGLLDRIDGVLFAVPIMFLGATVLEKLL